jgi:hypothetical protein
MAAHRHAAWIVLATLALAALPASAGDSLPVSVEVSPQTVRAGQVFTITVKTEPGATCSGQVHGRSSIGTYPAQVADDTGTIVYRYRVNPSDSSQTRLITFWCHKEGKSGSASAHFDIR